MSDELRIKTIELEIAGLEEKRRGLEKKQAELSQKYLFAAIGFFLGLAVAIFASQYWYCGGVLILAGAASAITQTSKKRGLQREIDAVSKEIGNYRTRMGEVLAGEVGPPAQIWK